MIYLKVKYTGRFKVKRGFKVAIIYTRQTIL
jgi:hypothetical protein